MIKIGDYVTRKSYNHDIVFKVIDIQMGNCILYGVCIRLSADSPVSDLKLYDGEVNDDDFAVEFDENINSSMRSNIVLEFQLADIFSDIKAYLLAKTFAQYRGYKVCIDGITVDKLQYLNRANLGADLIKIIWHPSFMDVINDDKHFMDYVNRAERAKMILCRVDDPNAVEVGNSLGINMYQGRYIQRLLNSNPKKTIFSIR